MTQHLDNEPRDRLAETAREIEVTPEMIAAGADVLATMDGEDFSIVAELVFTAMSRRT